MLSLYCISGIMASIIAKLAFTANENPAKTPPRFLWIQPVKSCTATPAEPPIGSLYMDQSSGLRFLVFGFDYLNLVKSLGEDGAVRPAVISNVKILNDGVKLSSSVDSYELQRSLRFPRSKREDSLVENLIRQIKEDCANAGTMFHDLRQASVATHRR